MHTRIYNQGTYIGEFICTDKKPKKNSIKFNQLSIVRRIKCLARRVVK